MPPAIKPLLIFDGNCQAQHLAAMIDASGAAKAIIGREDWGFLPAYKGHVARLLQPQDEQAEIKLARSNRARIIQVSQFSPFSKQKRARENVQSADARVLFPEVRLWAISPRRFYELYKADFDITRIFELDIESIARSQSSADFPVDVAGHIANEIQRKPLFHTVNHPTGSVLAKILEGLASKLAGECDAQAILAVAREAEKDEGLNFETDHPVSSANRATLGFEWGEIYELYAQMLQQAQLKDWHAFKKSKDRYKASFFNDTQYWRVRALLALDRDKANNVRFFEKLLSHSPGVSSPWLMYAQFLKSIGKADGILSLLARAERLLGDTAVRHIICARLQAILRQLALAEPHARRAWNLAPKNIQSVFPLIQVLALQGKKAEVCELLGSLRNRHQSELNSLKAFIARQKDGETLLDCLK